MATPVPKSHQRPSLVQLEVKREQRRIAADYREALGLLQAATAVPPELVEQIAELQRLVRDQGAELVAQAARITALEVRPAEDEDGSPRRAGRWHRLKEASRRTGYSENGLRRLCRLGRCVADYSGPHLLVNVDSVPRRSVVKMLKVQP
jgi:hypothetical protein